MAVGASVLSLCALVALGSGFLVFRDLNQYAESKDAYRNLAGYVEVPEQATDPTETKQDDADIVLPSVDFEALRENGPDIIGWLSLPDTAFMVRPQNRNAIILPKNMPLSTLGFIRVTS